MDIHVYILLRADDSYDVGLTRDGREKHTLQHQTGLFGGYTSTRRPVRLVWSRQFLRLDDAKLCERRLKGRRREQKEALIREDLSVLPRRTAKLPHPSTTQDKVHE